MSGRAGRRGYDLRGNVVFLGVPRTKSGRLVSCSLPPLMGTSPVSTMLALRLMTTFYAPTNTAPLQAEIVQGTRRLLANSFVAAANPGFVEQQLQHLRLSLELLRR